MIKSAAPVAPPRVSSSPGRAAPAAPRLASLLRGKSGARSRGARSSPMFLAKSGSVARSSSAAKAAEDDEPSSPKVTCIGQVRIRGNSKKKKKSGDDRPAAKPRCRCIQRALLCFGRTPPASGRPHRRTLWRRWGLGLWPSNYRQQRVFEKGDEAEVEAYTTPVAAARGSISSTTSDLENGDRDAEEETRVFITSAIPSPPKNALLLMRCRSAPHNRSSALATSRFAVSLSPPPPPAAAAAAEEEPAGAPVIGCLLPKHDEDESEVAAAALPVVLTRSKSEPASTATEKMAFSDVAAGFWNSSRSRRRLALVREEAAPPLRRFTR